MNKDLILEKDDPVNHPKHYNMYPLEVKEIIRVVLDEAEQTVEEMSFYQAYCLGSIVKYRLRAGLKDPAKLAEDIEKANFYLDEFRRS